MTGSLSPFANVSFRWLVAGRFVSMLGTAIAPIALAFAVIDLTGSATDLGLVLAARSIPLVLFVLVGGVVADRLPRHHVLRASNLVSVACQATAATLMLDRQRHHRPATARSSAARPSPGCWSQSSVRGGVSPPTRSPTPSARCA